MKHTFLFIFFSPVSIKTILLYDITIQRSMDRNPPFVSKNHDYLFYPLSYEEYIDIIMIYQNKEKQR